MNATTGEFLNTLADCLPETGVRIETTGIRDRLWLPVPSGADYSLFIDTHQSGEPVMGALLRGKPCGPFFWHFPLQFEDADEHEIVQLLAREARRVILGRNRIVQSIGFLSISLCCEVEEGGVWRPICGSVTIRLCFLPPLAFRRATWEYYSPSLVSAGPNRRATTVFVGSLEDPKPDWTTDRLSLVGCAALLFFVLVLAETMCGLEFR